MGGGTFPYTMNVAKLLGRTKRNQIYLIVWSQGQYLYIGITARSLTYKLQSHLRDNV